MERSKNISRRDKLTPKLARSIRKDIAGGIKQKFLAKRYGVSIRTISKIKLNKIYKNDDDGEHWDMENAQEEADNLDAESHLLQVDEPMI